jgi:hypothetical protein
MKFRLLVPMLLSSCAFAGPGTELELWGSSSSYVVGNQTLSLLPTDGYSFTPTIGTHFFGDPAPDYIDIAVNAFPDTDLHWFYLDLAVPQGQTLQPGFYPSATRYPFEASSVPGLSLYGDGRGDNQSTGYFDILEISYSGTLLESLAVDFVQYDELNPDAISSGSLRYNSTIPVASVPEVSSFFLCLSGFALILVGKNAGQAPGMDRAFGSPRRVVGPSLVSG